MTSAYPIPATTVTSDGSGGGMLFWHTQGDSTVQPLSTRNPGNAGCLWLLEMGPMWPEPAGSLGGIVAPSGSATTCEAVLVSEPGTVSRMIHAAEAERGRVGQEASAEDTGTPVRSVLEMLDSWLADESGYDERVWPRVKEAIEQNRSSTRKRFRG